MPSRTRNSRATMPTTSVLPPCELAMIILRKPARCTPSPISNQLRIRLSAEWVMVPPERRCSLDFPIVWVGRNSRRRSSGRRASTVLIRPSAIAVSVMAGSCGPCCSVEATGKIASVELGSSPANSLDLSSAQNRLVIMSPSVSVCVATDALGRAHGIAKVLAVIVQRIPAKSNQRIRKRRSSPRAGGGWLQAASNMIKHTAVAAPTAREEASMTAVRFLLNGTPCSEDGAPPSMTVLDWLRSRAHLTGTKEGCAEGDCGACTIVLGRRVDGSLQFRAVNSCLMMLPQIDNRAVLTVEGLAGPEGALHPAQQALVDADATQCGFCTPGFVMAMFAFHHGGEPADTAIVHEALAGNLCRCTGYRPIAAACRRIARGPADRFVAELPAL